MRIRKINNKSNNANNINDNKIVILIKDAMEINA